MSIHKCTAVYEHIYIHTHLHDIRIFMYIYIIYISMRSVCCWPQARSVWACLRVVKGRTNGIHSHPGVVGWLGGWLFVQFPRLALTIPQGARYYWKVYPLAVYSRRVWEVRPMMNRPY